MAAWVLIPCLNALFAEFNRIAPNRDEASDGAVGDLAHQQEVSDHNPDETGSVPIHDADKINEVHAIDVDDDLRESDLTMEKVVQFLLARCRSGAEKRLRYIIYNRRIWDYRSDWQQKTYTGPSAHTEHGHFSASYETARESDTSSWHLEEIPVSLTAADKNWISTEVNRIVDQSISDAFVSGEQSDGTPTSKIGRDAWNQGIPNGLVEGAPRSKAWQVLKDVGVELDQVHTEVAEIKAQLDAEQPPAA